MPIGNIAKGSKETIRVRVTDASEVVSDLSGSGPTFTVKDDADVNKVTDAAATASGMIISCLLDTTVGGVWDEGEYRLFVKYTVGSEVIVKGPHYFTISNR